jgi:hypothetical protein
MSETESGVVKTTGFGSTEVERRAETAATAAAASARAMIEAQYIVAMRQPRDWDLVRQRILKECDRPSFAREAIYHKPIGKGITGLSIRFAEVAVRCMGNLTIPTTTTLDDDYKRIVNQSVVDLESNVHYSRDVTIDKTVERLSVKDGETILSRRTNSRGQQTFTIAASEDALLNKEGALVSKALRTLVLRLLPGDIQSEARERVGKTMSADIKKDPDGQKRAILDAFFVLGIKPAEIKELLGHDMDALSIDELQTLRSLHNAIKDGEASIKEAIANAKEQRGETEPSKAGTSGVSDAAEKFLKNAKPETKQPSDETKAPSGETIPPEPGGEAPQQKTEPEEKRRGRPKSCKMQFCKEILKSEAEIDSGYCDAKEHRAYITKLQRDAQGTAPPPRGSEPVAGAQPTPDPNDSDKSALAALIGRLRHKLMTEEQGDVHEVSIRLSSIMEGRCDNFDDLPAFLRDFPKYIPNVSKAADGK